MNACFLYRKVDRRVDRRKVKNRGILGENDSNRQHRKVPVRVPINGLTTPFLQRKRHQITGVRFLVQRKGLSVILAQPCGLSVV